jgi:AraC-like DNA-binding protein
MATLCVLLSEIDLADGIVPVRVSTGEVTYPPGGRLGPRWQHDVELVVVHSGSARIRIDAAMPLAVFPDRVALLVPGHREEFEFDVHEATRHSWVQIGIAGAVSPAILEAPRLLPLSAALGRLVHEAVAVLRPRDASADQLAAALGVGAIWRYVADATARVDGPPAPVELARRHIDLRLADPELNLERVAAAAHVTAAHLVRRFRAELGTTPMAYLWQRRVAAGVELLVSTGLPVGEVARRAGFRSVYHFSRRVKEATGLPPTEVRRRRWSQTRPEAEYGDE